MTSSPSPLLLATCRAPPTPDLGLVSPQSLEGLSRNVVSLLHLSVEQDDLSSGQEHVEEPDLLTAELEEAIAESARLRSA